MKTRLPDHKSCQQPALKLEKLPVSMHIYISRIDKWKRKRNTPNLFKPKWKDASSDHTKDRYHLCYHQSLQCMPWPWLDKAEISAYYGTSECLDPIWLCHRPLNPHPDWTWAHPSAPSPLGLLLLSPKELWITASWTSAGLRWGTGWLH